MGINVDIYNSIINNSSEFNIGVESISIPKPTERDYSRGYIVRYFVQKANDEKSTIFEVDEGGFANLRTTPFYKTTSLDWVISGEGDGVKEANRKSILFASKDIKYISLYLPNLLQFWKK
jgi:hypothetical protein